MFCVYVVCLPDAVTRLNTVEAVLISHIRLVGQDTTFRERVFCTAKTREFERMFSFVPTVLPFSVDYFPS
jgi:hypothetical protein